ncbi:MAG: hypothetical protein KF746_04625 [Chitinophagaceae bacterium]|nr:hypothetical protein [Chitinophagaceae bacterium]
MKRAKRYFTILLALLALQSDCFAGNMINEEGNGYRELNARGGLSNFFRKATRGDSVKVAYLGGSITAQNGWRVYSLDWFKQRFPKAAFTEINAAIGGTGSDFGVFRLNDQVLKFDPDLVFVEFAVNDRNTPAEKITRSMEGIVRQVWQHNPSTDICFIYTLRDNFLDTLQNATLPLSAKTMEIIADKYGVPSINFVFEVADQVKHSKLVFTGASKELNGIKVFSPDGVHPYPETGHHIYLEVLQRSFEKMIPLKARHTKKRKLPEPIAPDYFAHTQMIGLEKVSLSKGWEILPVKDHADFSGFGRFLSRVGEAAPGETLSFRFKGTTVGIYDIMGPGAGRIEVTLDGQVKDTVYRFNAYCTYWLMSYFLLDHLPDKEHEVVFRVIPESFDKAAILKIRNQTMTDPEKYKKINWYVGKILLDGQLYNP